MPTVWSLQVRRLCGTISNTFLKSVNIAPISLLLYSAVLHVLATVIATSKVLVDLPFLDSH